MLPLAIALATQFAPSILKYVTGSDAAGAVASKVIDIANIVTGGAPDPVGALAADPALAMEFNKAIMANETAIVEALLADVQNARAMQIAALAQGDLFSKRFVYYFATAWSLFTMAYVAAVTFWPPVTETGKSIANTVIGFLLGTAVATIFAYFFGSTDGGKAKSALLALAGK